MRDLFPNALHVARREYAVRVRSRLFVITTALLSLALIAVTVVPAVLAAAGVFGGAVRIEVDVRAEGIATDPVTAIRSAIAAGEGPVPPGESEGPSVTRTEDAEAAIQRIRDGELQGLLVVTRGPGGDLAFEYVTEAGPTSLTRLLVTQAASSVAVADRLSRAGIPPAESAQLFRPPDFEVIQADLDAERPENYGAALLLGYALVILTFMAILTYGNWVAQSVAEEKSTRVMELLITAATPRQLLAGKVLGTGAAGLTQYLVVVGALVLGLTAGGPVSAMFGQPGEPLFSVAGIGPGTLAAFAAFFLLGFLVYSTLYAAAGSMVSRLEDVQQAVGVLIFLAMAGYFISFTALNDPEAGWVAALSLVPFFSPYLMPVRMLLSSVAPAEVALALGLLALTLVASVWIAGRIYSAGVLLYGQRVGLRTVLRAARVSR